MKLDPSILLQQKIEAGSAPIIGKKILHTAPHHDDIVLSYHTYAIKNLAGNENHILYATSGFNGVSNEFIARVVRKIDRTTIAAAMKLSYQQILQQFVQAYHDKNKQQMFTCKMYMMVQFVAEIFACCDHDTIVDRFNLIRVFCSSKKQDLQEIELIQELKARIRESEADRKWMVCKGDVDNVQHFRAEFYGVNTTNFDRAMQADIERLTLYLDTMQPDIITVALDPCGIGPKNHFTTLQLVVAALQRSKHTNIEILGYRNVWSNFELQEASIIIPVTQSEIDEAKSIFINCFATQKSTLFFGTDIDGNFADQAEQIQKIQLQQVQESLSKDIENNQKLIVDKVVGAIFMKNLTIDALIKIILENKES